MAPSAVNNQPYDIWVITGDNAKAIADARAEFNKFVTDCPVFIVFTDADYGNDRLDRAAETMNIDYRTQDIGESIAYLTLQAEDLGLSTCILGSFDILGVQKVLGTSARVQTVIAIGYATEGYPIREKKRKSVSQNVHFL